MPRYNPSAGVLNSGTMAQRRYNMWLRAQQQLYMMQQRQVAQQQAAEAAAQNRSKLASQNRNMAEAQRLERFTPWARDPNGAPAPAAAPAGPVNRYIPGPDPQLRPEFRPKKTGVRATEGKYDQENVMRAQLGHPLIRTSDNPFPELTSPLRGKMTPMPGVANTPAPIDNVAAGDPANGGPGATLPTQGQVYGNNYQGMVDAEQINHNNLDVSEDPYALTQRQQWDLQDHPNGMGGGLIGMGSQADDGMSADDSGEADGSNVAMDGGGGFDLPPEQVGMQSGAQDTGTMTGQIGGGLYAPADPQSISNTGDALAANENAIVAPQQQADKQLWAQIYRGNPEAMSIGLQRGLLYHSPQQKSQIAELQHSLQRVETDPTLNPAERADARAQVLRQLNAIQPMVTPVDQQPVDPVSRIQSEITTMPDAVTGKPMRVTHDRSGRPVEFITEREKEQVKTEGVAERERIKALAARGFDAKGTPLLDSDGNRLAPIKEGPDTRAAAKAQSALEKHQEGWDKHFDEELRRLRDISDVDEEKMAPQQIDELRARAMDRTVRWYGQRPTGAAENGQSGQQPPNATPPQAQPSQQQQDQQAMGTPIKPSVLSQNAKYTHVRMPDGSETVVPNSQLQVPNATLPQPQSKADYDSIPAGSRYFNYRDGTVRIKQGISDAAAAQHNALSSGTSVTYYPEGFSRPQTVTVVKPPEFDGGPATVKFPDGRTGEINPDHLSSIPNISNEADAMALPPGSVFIGPDGKKHVRPMSSPATLAERDALLGSYELAPDGTHRKRSGPPQLQGGYFQPTSLTNSVFHPFQKK